MKFAPPVALLSAAFCLCGGAVHGEDVPVTKPKVALTLVIPDAGDRKAPKVPRVDHRLPQGVASMLHARVVLRNLTKKELFLVSHAEYFGPWVEMRAADGKSWVRLIGSNDFGKIASAPGASIVPKEKLVMDVYFDNYVLGAKDKKFTGRVTLRVVYTGEDAKAWGGLWTGPAVSAPVECVIE